MFSSLSKLAYKPLLEYLTEMPRPSSLRADVSLQQGNRRRLHAGNTPAGQRELESRLREKRQTSDFG